MKQYEPLIISTLDQYQKGGNLYYFGMIAAGMMKDHSQNGEQAHILHYLDTIGLKTGHLVDLGAGDGFTMSNTRALLERGWTGDLYDGDPKGAKDVQHVWIDLEFLTDANGYRMIDPCHFLNIDLDGNDYHILERLLGVWCGSYCDMPALIVCEINPIFARDEAKVMPYNAKHVWNNDTYYGMSLAACEQLANDYGYTLAYLHAGINAFLLRNDHAKAHPELIRPIEYRVKVDHRPHDPKLPWITLT